MRQVIKDAYGEVTEYETEQTAFEIHHGIPGFKAVKKE